MSREIALLRSAKATTRLPRPTFGRARNDSGEGGMNPAPTRRGFGSTATEATGTPHR
jgi:hypothetical protein